MNTRNDENYATPNIIMMKGNGKTIQIQSLIRQNTESECEGAREEEREKETNSEERSIFLIMFTNVILFCTTTTKKPVWNNIDFLVVFFLRTEFQYTTIAHFYWSDRKKTGICCAPMLKNHHHYHYQRDRKPEEVITARDTFFIVKPVL